MGRVVSLDEECCVGCGACAELCPEVFEMSEDGEKAHVIFPEGGSVGCVEEAIDTCPNGCISREK
ncbi:MAG: ferredoxin [Syntrophobacteraceae bacterium]|nr:ferredoxin [Syntrophobacteraceae bacterium]